MKCKDAKMSLKNVKELIQKAKEHLRSPIAIEFLEDYEAFIDLKYQTDGKAADYAFQLEAARLKFMESAQKVVQNFGINPEALKSHLTEHFLNSEETSPEKEALQRAFTQSEEPKRAFCKALKNKTGRV
jgi:hypothetical protein